MFLNEDTIDWIEVVEHGNELQVHFESGKVDAINDEQAVREIVKRLDGDTFEIELPLTE